MALQGTLDTFSLPDVLRLLATTTKTGRLRIEGDRGQGSIWLSDGGIVDADADRAIDGTPTDEVLFELLRFSAGSFAFDGKDTAGGAGKPEDVESLLRRANALLSEWTELEAVVPSLEHEVTLAADLSVDEVTIDADRWRSLVAVASGKTVGELATMLGLTELGVSRAVRDLVDLGVAEVAPPGTIRGAKPAHRAPVPDPSTPREPRPEPEGVTPVRPLTGETPRAGWRQTGEVPAVGGGERRSAPLGNGRDRSLDETAATPPPAPPKPADPPTKGSLASRLGLSRNASTSGRGGEGPTTGSTPPAPGAAPPPRSSNDAGRSRNGSAEPGRPPQADAAAPRRSAADGPAAPAGPSTSPGRGSQPGSGSASGAPSSPFDGGRLGPPPGAQDTGQIRPVSPSSLPPDLHWAADDTGGIPLNGGSVSSPFSGLSSLGPARPEVGRPGPGRPAPRDGEVAPHVAAMSTAARSAVQATVGNAGGSTGRVPSQGEDIAQRGRLISFLSTVR